MNAAQPDTATQIADDVASPARTRKTPLPPPRKVQCDLPLSGRGRDVVARSRSAIARILEGRDAERLLVVCGPCSIHDVDAALVYAERLRRLAQRVSGQLEIVMRTYFEKPRSVVGWKGLLYDPLQPETASGDAGVTIARRLLAFLNDAEVPCATEFLNPLLALYIEDAIAYGSIGSRTAESQIHRELASQLSMPMGMKNGMDGNPDSAINAVRAAARPHSVFGMNWDGEPCLIETGGNPHAHVVLRGGASGPNFDSVAIARACSAFAGSRLRRPAMIDCSHGNSGKDHRRQAEVARSVVAQFLQGQTGIAGLMLESNLEEGRQDADGPAPLRFGQSITDACIGWEETESLLLELAAQVAGSGVA